MKIKTHTKNTSTTPNTKLNQYLDKNHLSRKSPINVLNKSQNFTKIQKNYKSGIKNLMINNQLLGNAKKILPMNNLNNNNNKNWNSNNKSLPKNSSLPNYYTKNRNSNNKSNYFISHKKNNTNTKFNNSNINKSINTKNNNLNNNSGLLNYLKNNNTQQKLYQTKTSLCSINNNFINNTGIINKLSKKNITSSNLNNNKYDSNIKDSKSPINKIKSYLATDDLLNSRNSKHSLYSYVITEDYKKNERDSSKDVSYFQNKKQKNMSKNICDNNKINNSNILSLKKYSSNTNVVIPKNKSNTPINLPYKQMINSIPVNQISSSGGENLSTEKTNSGKNLDSNEHKIMNEILELKNINNNNEKNLKLQMIFEEAIDYLIPKESQNIFLLILKEFSNINNDYYKNINELKLIANDSKEKLNNYESKNKELMNKLKNKEKEIKTIKKENGKILKRGNEYFKQLNKKNIDDLDALYFYDKILNETHYENRKKEKTFDKKNIPKLNLDYNYIEKCKQKEIDKINEANLTPFQKIALQFEVSETN